MIFSQGTFDRMLQVTRDAGLKGKPMPNFGQLRAIPKGQLAQLNSMYSDARTVHAAKSK